MGKSLQKRCPEGEFMNFLLVHNRVLAYRPDILSEARSVYTDRPSLLSLRFWPLQCMGWLGLALLTLPIKLYFFGDFAVALKVTLMREGIAFLLTICARQLWKGHWRKIDRKPVRQVLLVIGFALFGATVDIVYLLLFGHRLEPMVMEDPSFQIVSFSYRALLLVIWGLLYFGIKGMQARQQLILAMREAELRMLRTQISPHFFFNALNTMLACSKREPDKLAGLIQSLANYLRYTLKHHDSLYVPMVEEYEAVLDYLTVEKARFREDLLVESYLDPSVAREAVPGILLQPLLENAVKHGRATSPRPLRIRMNIVRATPEWLEITIANTGYIKNSGTTHGFGVGLKNLRQRLQLTYPGHEVLSIEESEGWVLVTIRLPVRSEAEPLVTNHEDHS